MAMAPVPYADALAWQQRLLKERLAWQKETPPNVGYDVLLLLEHPSVYTLGRGSSLQNLKFDHSDPNCPHEVHNTDRGGEVTWHGPGQIVGYPVVDLTYHKKDLHWYLRSLEEVIILTLARYGLQGERDAARTGVWVNGAKIAAIGLNASRWITTHGFALNVCPEMKGFERIVPCGIGDRPVCSLVETVARGSSPSQLEGVDTASVRRNLIQAFAEVFKVDIEAAGSRRKAVEEVLQRAA